MQWLLSMLLSYDQLKIFSKNNFKIFLFICFIYSSLILNVYIKLVHNPFPYKKYLLKLVHDFDQAKNMYIVHSDQYTISCDRDVVPNEKLNPLIFDHLKLS